MISIFCNQCRDDKYYSIKLTFNKSDLLSLLVIDGDEEIYYGFMLKTWSCDWMYVDKDTYKELLGVIKRNETKQI